MPQSRKKGKTLKILQNEVKVNHTVEIGPGSSPGRSGKLKSFSKLGDRISDLFSVPGPVGGGVRFISSWADMRRSTKIGS